MKKFIAASLLSLGLAVPAHAGFVVTDIDAGDSPAVANNAFETDLSGAGFTEFFKLVGLTLSDAVIVEFFVLGSESNFQNGFTAGSVSFAEAGEGSANDLPFGATPIGTAAFLAGPVDWTFNVISGIGSVAGCVGTVCGVNTQAFGIFSEVAYVSGSSLDVGDRIVLAFDDDGAGPDDNHDDLLIGARIKAVIPEPATWGLMILGFAGLGAMTRRRTAVTA